MYHGISAFNRSGKIYDLLKRVEVLPTVSACYADRPIGPIGVYCDIEHADRVDYISDRDVWSYVDEDGIRRVSDKISVMSEEDVHYVEPGDDLYQIYCEYSRKADMVRRHRKYAEISAVASPSAIWVDCSFGFKWIKAARIIARRFGLIVIFVKSVR